MIYLINKIKFINFVTLTHFGVLFCILVADRISCEIYNMVCYYVRTYHDEIHVIDVMMGV